MTSNTLALSVPDDIPVLSEICLTLDDAGFTFTLDMAEPSYPLIHFQDFATLERAADTIAHLLQTGA